MNRQRLLYQKPTEFELLVVFPAAFSTSGQVYIWLKEYLVFKSS